MSVRNAPKQDPCWVCRTRPDSRGQILPEAEITSHSLHNAHLLIAQRGRPERVELLIDEDERHLATFTWKDGSYFVLDGLAWGYRGTAPWGLADLFHTLGVDVVIETIAAWPRDAERWRELWKGDVATFVPAKAVAS